MSEEKDIEKKDKAELDKDSSSAEKEKDSKPDKSSKKGKSAKHGKDSDSFEQIKEKKPFNKKKLKYGAMSTIITVVVIAVVVVVNLIAGILTDRKGLKIDLTEEQYYEISDQTVDYLKTLNNDVEISVILKESTLKNFEIPEYQNSANYLPVGKMIMETFDRFKQSTDHISIEFYDMASNPDIITNFNYNGDINEGNIVVKSNDNIRVLDVYGLLDVQQDYYYGYKVAGYKGEQELLSAVMSVTDSNPKNVALISKLNGSEISYESNSDAIETCSSLLDKNGYQVTAVDIMNDAVSPDEYDMIILPAPANDLTDSSIKKLEDFLYNNGNLDKDMIYIADYTQRETPNINAFLETWGVEVAESIVLEADESKGQYIMMNGTPISMPIAQIADSEYSEGLSNTKLPIVIPFSRPVNLLFESNVDRTTRAVLQTSETSYLYPPDSSGTQEQSAKNLMAVVTKSNMDSDNVEHVNHLMTIGGISIFNSSLTNSGSYNNAEFIMNAINKMCGKETSIVIAQKNLSNKTIDIKASQLKAISRVVIYIIPLIVVAAGIVVFLRRRNK